MIKSHVIYNLKLPVSVKILYDNNTDLNLGVFLTRQVANKVKTESSLSNNSKFIKDYIYGPVCGYGYSKKNVEVLFSVEYNLNDRFEKYTDRSKIHTLTSGINFRYYFRANK